MNVFKECLRHGIAPFTIDESIKLYYYRGLKEWKNEKGYLMDTCLAGQDKYKKLMGISLILIIRDRQLRSCLFYTEGVSL